MKENIVKEKCSYSRYRGITDSFRYDAINDYFKYEVDGNIICTDTEKDIDFDGNIILLTPKGEVVHIGTVPLLEDGAGNPSFRLDSDGMLHVKSKVFYDNSHHHSGYEEEVIDCHFTEERKVKIRQNKMMLYLSQTLKPFTGGSYGNRFRIYPDKDGGIEIKVNLLKWGYRHYSKTEKNISIRLKCEDGSYHVKDEDILYDEEHLFSGERGIKPVIKALEQFYEHSEKEEV